MSYNHQLLFSYCSPVLISATNLHKNCPDKNGGHKDGQFMGSLQCFVASSILERDI